MRCARSNCLQQQRKKNDASSRCATTSTHTSVQMSSVTRIAGKQVAADRVRWIGVKLVKSPIGAAPKVRCGAASGARALSAAAAAAGQLLARTIGVVGVFVWRACDCRRAPAHRRAARRAHLSHVLDLCAL